tara:strand:- start:2192 stop:4213 length:2022 start_codon:yes stop_codon:yes gene_type:complete
MVVFTGKTDASIYKFAPKAARGSYSFLDNFSMAKKLFDVLNASDSSGVAYSEVLQPYVDTINERAKENNLEIPDNPDASAASRWSDIDWWKTWGEPGVAYKKQIVNPGLAMVGYSSMDFIGGNDSEGKFGKSLDIMLDFIKQHPEVYPEYQDLTRESLAEEVKKHVMSIKEEAEDIESLSPGISKIIARFGGSATGALADPVVAGSIIVSGPAAPLVASAGGSLGVSALASVMLTEAVIGAGSEALIQQDIKKWHESLGMEYPLEDMLYAITAAGAAGAAIPGLFYVGGKAVQLTKNQMLSGYEAFKKAGLLKRNPIRDQQELQVQVHKDREAVANIYDAAQKKTAESPKARAEHNAREKEAVNAQREFRPNNMPERPFNRISDEAKIANIKKLKDKIPILAKTMPKGKARKAVENLDEIISRDVVERIEKSIAQKQSAKIFPWAKTEINRADATPEELLASDLTNIKVEEALNVIEEAQLFPWIKRELGRRTAKIKEIEAKPAEPKLTDDAEEVLAKADKGEAPASVTPKLKKIADDNDVVVEQGDTPEIIVDKLKEKRATVVAAQSAPEQAVTRTQIIEETVPSAQTPVRDPKEPDPSIDAFDDIDEGMMQEMPDLEREILESTPNIDEVVPIPQDLEDGSVAVLETSVRRMQEEAKKDDILEQLVSKCTI